MNFIKKILPAILVVLLAFLAYLYLFTDPNDPEGLRQKIFVPLGLASAPEKPAEKPAEKSGEKAPEPLMEQKTPEEWKEILKEYQACLKAISVLKTQTRNVELSAQTLLNPPEDNELILVHAPLFIDAAAFLQRPLETAKENPGQTRRLLKAVNGGNCPACQGSALAACNRCKGKGEISVIDSSAMRFTGRLMETGELPHKTIACRKCNSTGKIICKKCLPQIKSFLAKEEKLLRDEIRKRQKEIQVLLPKTGKH